MASLRTNPALTVGAAPYDYIAAIAAAELNYLNIQTCKWSTDIVVCAIIGVI